MKQRSIGKGFGPGVPMLKFSNTPTPHSPDKESSNAVIGRELRLMYVDLCKSAQKQIDLMNQAILKNTLASATPRFFIRADGAVNENEYADWTKPFVHTNGNLGSDSIAPIHTAALDSV